MFDNMPSALPMAKDGKIRALAQTTLSRSPAAPDVPTVAETVPGFEATTWFAMFAPAGTPREIVLRINAEMQRVFKLPDVLDKLKALGLEPQFRMLGMIPYPDLGALMQASVALLNPSLFEGWSTPVEEARALGVPLLLSDLPVHLEQAGADASYFDRHSAASLAAALAAFTALTPEQRASRKALARTEATRRVRQFAEDFASLAHDCAARRPKP